MGEIATIPLLATIGTIGQPDVVSKPASSYNLPIGYLRAFIAVLVLAHQAALAYHPFAPPVPASLVTQPRWWQAFPVVDSQRWSGFALFVGFNFFHVADVLSLRTVCVEKPRSQGSRRLFA
jgi:hypothetical protein